MTHAKFNFNQLMLTLIFGIQASELPWAWRMTEKAGPDRVNIPVGRITVRLAIMLNKAAEELPSESDITRADDIELLEISEKASGIISQIKDVQTDISKT